MKLITLALFLLLGLLQYELWYSEGGMMSVFHLKQRIAEQIETNQKLKESNAAIIADIQDLKNGTQAVEERARNELGMVQKDEVFYQVNSAH